MITKNLSVVVSMSNNGPGKSWDPIYIHYHGGICGTSNNYLHKNGICSKKTTKEDLGLYWNNVIHMIDRESLSKWDKYGSPIEKLRNFNFLLIINGST